MTYDKFDLAYIAGFFDGEGCTTMSKQTEKSNALRKNGRSRYALQVNITQKSRDTLDWVSLLFGGSVRIHKTKTRKQSDLCFRLSFSGRDTMKNFISAILPYLKMKRKQAEYALEYLETVRDDNLGSTRVPEEINHKRLQLHDLLRYEKIVDNTYTLCE